MNRRNFFFTSLAAIGPFLIPGFVKRAFGVNASLSPKKKEVPAKTEPEKHIWMRDMEDVKFLSPLESEFAKLLLEAGREHGEWGNFDIDHRIRCDVDGRHYNYEVDFVFRHLKVGMEVVEGASWSSEYFQKRCCNLIESGWCILHFSKRDIEQNPEKVKQKITQVCEYSRQLKDLQEEFHLEDQHV